MFRLPPLNSLRAFEVAARHESFKSAAEELCVTQGAVSRHIAKLEEYLGTPLFARMHRRVALTSEGETFLREIQGAFLRISHATTSLTNANSHNTLTIKSPPTSAIWWLVPRLGRFHARFPEIQVQLMSSHLPVDFEQEEIDVAIQYGPPDGSKVLADRLFGEVLVAVCNQELLDTAGPFRRPEDLAGQVLLHSIRRPTDWRRWLEATVVETFEAGQEIVFENSAMTYQGALDGIGIALGQLAFVGGELSAGRLVAPFDIFLRNETAYYLVIPPYKAHLPRVDAFREWVADEARATREAHTLL